MKGRKQRNRHQHRNQNIKNSNQPDEVETKQDNFQKENVNSFQNKIEGENHDQTRNQDLQIQLISCYMPEELWVLILSRLPVKSLLRFKCVCKGWRSLINESRFVFNHFSRSRYNHQRTHLLVIEHPKMWSIRHGGTLTETDALPMSRKWSTHYVRGYVHGVVLLAQQHYPSYPPTASFILLNLSARKFINLPSLPIRCWRVLEESVPYKACGRLSYVSQE